MYFANSAGVLVLIFCGVGSCAGQVLDLDDSFSDKKGDRAFLVKFYAPWCGHCRKLEPTYHQVYLELKNSKITVAKVDATRFTRLASEFDVRGYPTIKFIQGDRVFTHNGERSKEGIIEFAKRAYGPQVRQLTSIGRLNEAKAEHAATAFFLYVGPTSDADQLYLAYKSLAEKFAVLSYFYAGDKNVLPSHIVTEHYPTVVVFKDKTFIEFTAVTPTEDAPPLEDALSEWIAKERFVAFPKIAGVGLNEMSSLGKLLAIFVVDDSGQMNDKQTRYRDVGQQLAVDARYADYKSRYQFVWMTDVDVAGNIIMSSTLESPFFFVLDPHAHQYYIPRWTSLDSLSPDDVTEFLDAINSGDQQAYGGTGLGQRFQRLFYDIWSTIYGIYRESVWLALMVFGIPSLVIGIICYTLCCLEPADEDELNAGSDEDGDGSDTPLEEENRDVDHMNDGDHVKND